MRNPRVQEIIKELNKLGGTREGTNDSLFLLRKQSGLTAELQALIAEEQTQASDKMEKHTVFLVRLTKWLVFLTVILLIFTTYMCYDIYARSYGKPHSDHHSSQESKADE